MRNFRPAFALFVALSGGLVGTTAKAQDPQPKPAVKAEQPLTDFGLGDRLVSHQQARALKLTSSQRTRFSKLQSATRAEIKKLTEAGKKISHSHAPGEPCPACAHAAKVRAAYRKYFTELGKILTAEQERTLTQLVRRENEATRSKGS